MSYRQNDSILKDNREIGLLVQGESSKPGGDENEDKREMETDRQTDR